jgi:hypothetical protein
MADESLEETIRTAAAKPSKASSDGQSVEAVPVRDLIEVDRYLASRSAGVNPRKFVRVSRFNPPGGS